MSKLMNYTGHVVDVFNLQKDDINADVIILGACRINRFLGQTAYAYPVAAHLIGSYNFLNDNGASLTLKKQWLIHEAFESYSGVDLPSPLKAELPLYKEAENKALKVIAEVFNIESYEDNSIKLLDRSIMITEALTLMPNSTYWLDFASQNNIEPIDSSYVLKIDECKEELLYHRLQEIWNFVFVNQQETSRSS